MVEAKEICGAMEKMITKRSGHTVAYDRMKIYNAIAAANRDGVAPVMTDAEVDAVTENVERELMDRENITVEEIQDIVERELMKHGFYDIAKKYITYRQKHAERRAAQKHLMIFSLPTASTAISSATMRTSTRMRRWASC